MQAPSNVWARCIQTLRSGKRFVGCLGEGYLKSMLEFDAHDGVHHPPYIQPFAHGGAAARRPLPCPPRRHGGPAGLAAPVDDRHAQPKSELSRSGRQKLRIHGVALDESEIAQLLELDTELYVRGIGIWLDRRER